MYGLNQFCRFIEELKSNNYNFKSFSSELDIKSICLRHDVDFSLFDALEMSKIEKN